MDGQTQEECARLVEAMILQKPWCDKTWARVALGVAARAIRRGRHLTPEEKWNNLISAINE